MNVESNSDRWIGTLPKRNTDNFVPIDSDKWIDTLPRKNTDKFVPKKNSNSSVKKYSLTVILFVVGLIVVSIIKNETRNLQNKINDLKASINVLKIDLHQATLDHEVITSPDNISQLAKEYLDLDLIAYEKSQIKQLNEEVRTITELEKTKHTKTIKKKNNETKEEINIRIAKKIETTKTGLRKLQELYSKPEKIPDEIKLLLVKNIEAKKSALKQIYSKPNDTIKLGTVQRWAGMQVLKAALGMPMIPGK